MAYSSQGMALIVVCVVFPILALSTILLRIKARSRAQKNLDASDYFLFFAMFLTLCNSVTCIAGAVLDGLGEPLPSLAPEQEVGFMKVLFAMQFFYVFSVSSVKIAVLLLYKSIFIKVAFEKVANGMIVIVSAWTIAFFFVTLFQDDPISRNWGTVGTTIDFRILYIAENLTDIALDLFILCMPLTVITTLQINTRKKWLLSGMFCLGAFCVISSTVRFCYIVLFRQEFQSRSNDFSSTNVSIIIWGAIEPCTSIIAACLPTLGALLPGRSKKSRQPTLTLSLGSRTHKRASDGVPAGSAEHICPR